MRILKDNDAFADATLDTVALRVDQTAFGAGVAMQSKLVKWLGIDAAVGYS